VLGSRKHDGLRKRWEDNIRECTGLPFCASQRAGNDRDEWLGACEDIITGAPKTTLFVMRAEEKKKWE
jgi:hypothetical protein